MLKPALALLLRLLDLDVEVEVVEGDLHVDVDIKVAGLKVTHFDFTWDIPDTWEPLRGRKHKLVAGGARRARRDA